MKALVIYDSQYGNTAQIAQAIAEGLIDASSNLAEVDLRKIDDARPTQLTGFDVLIIGSPTQRFNVTTGMRDFLRDIPKNALAGVIVAAFDTRLTDEELHSHGAVLGKLVDWFGYAAPRISESLAKHGGRVAVPPEGFYVGGTEGPLLTGELERATSWARQILATYEERMEIAENERVHA